MQTFAHKDNNSPVEGNTSDNLKPAFCKNRFTRLAGIGLGILIGLAPVSDLLANQRDQVKRIYDRLAGVPPTTAELNRIVNAINTNGEDLAWAASEAMKHPSFYNVTLKNFAAPWTNEAQSVFEDINDYSATVIGLIRDGGDFRRILYDNIIYTSDNASVTPYSNNSNQHYIDLERNNIDLSQVANLSLKTQTAVTGLVADATAGIMTTRAAARAFFVDGTNRAMFRFTMINHLCYDMEQIKDNTRSADRIRQDVSRSPGGDSRLFLTNCLGCHSGMDPMVQAFANYEWGYKDINPDNPDVGRLVYTPGVVQEKYHINASNFKGGYFTRDSGWSNYWRNGPNAWLGWGENPTPEYSANISIDSKGVSSGVGAKSLGMELAHSDAFARCQVKKVFKTVCLRAPDASDTANFDNMVNAFKVDYNMKQAFGRAAVYCSGN